MNKNKVNEISVVIPCYSDYNSTKIIEIYNILSTSFERFEVVLCTSLNFKGMCNSTISLTNNRPYLKCYCTKGKTKEKVLKCGVSSCMYNMIVIIDLENFSNIDLNLLSSISSTCNTLRYNAFYSDSLLIMRSMDLRDILTVCNDCSLLGIFNICDYLRFKFINIRSFQEIDFLNICTSNKEYTRYIKSRRLKVYDKQLCHLLVGERKVI